MRTALLFLFTVFIAVAFFWIKKESAGIQEAMQSIKNPISSVNLSDYLPAVGTSDETTSDMSYTDPDCGEMPEGFYVELGPSSLPDSIYGPEAVYAQVLDANSLAMRENHPLARLFEKTTPPGQLFEIDNNKQIVLKTQRGSIVTIPGNCFVNTKGKLITSDIKIEVKELFSTSDLLLANLPSYSNNGLLETEGAFYIDATAKGQKLQINPAKWIYVEPAFPKKLNIKTRKPVTNTPATTENNNGLGFSFMGNQSAKDKAQAMQPLPAIGKQLAVNWLFTQFSPLVIASPAMLFFNGREVFEKIKSYDTILQKMDVPPMPFNNTPPNLGDSLRQHLSRPLNLIGRNTYVITQTGWTNINRYKALHQPLKALRVKIEGTPQDDLTNSAFLVFKNFKTILAAQPDKNGNLLFHGIPANEKAYVVGLGYKNNQPYIDIIDLDTGSNQPISLSLRATTFDMLKYQISQLN